MTDTTEVLITSDASASSWSISVWDYNTGTSLHSYKGGGVISPKTLNIINNDYLIAAERLKPLLHVWPINSQEVVKNTRFVCPGRVTTLAVSTNGMYCAAGIEDKLYIWHISSGRLLAIASKHFQPITKVLFSSDGSYVITTGEDGLILIWPLAHLISLQSNDLVAQSTAGQTDPIYTISDHSMPIKDMYVGKSGLNARLVTVSNDRTMKLYQLVSGTQLLSVVFDVCLTAVTMNLSETCAYVGTVDGLIYELSFINPPRNREYHINKAENPVFKGHTKTVTCLSVSVDGQTLASGAADEQVIIWHIPTKQKIRTIPHKGAITTTNFTISPKNMFDHDIKLTTIISPFQRSTESEDEIIEVIHSTDRQLPFNNDQIDLIDNKHTSDNKDNSNLVDEINKLKAINAKLYQFTLDKVLSNVENNVSTDNEPKNKRKRRSMI